MISQILQAAMPVEACQVGRPGYAIKLSRNIMNKLSFIFVLLLTTSPHIFAMSLHDAMADRHSNHFACDFDGHTISNCRAVSDTTSKSYSSEKSSGDKTEPKFFMMQGGIICTGSEMMWATVFFGNWTAGNPDLGTPGDPVLEGAQALFAGVIFIAKMFDNNKINSRFADLKPECAMEFLDHACKLEGRTHPCFKDFNPQTADGSYCPPIHLNPQEQQSLQKQMNDPIMKALLGHH